MMHKNKGNWTCTACGKAVGFTNNIRQHVEANHILTCERVEEMVGERMDEMVGKKMEEIRRRV